MQAGSTERNRQKEIGRPLFLTTDYHGWPFITLNAHLIQRDRTLFQADRGIYRTSARLINHLLS
jgi:hypothetical protein